MNRVFYFTGHRLSVLHWNGKVYLGGCSFEPDVDGLEKFRQYLLTSEKANSRFLVDIIEEDFRIETIPHVFGKDRSAVTGRLLDRYYRSSRQFVYSEVVGRRKSGRKDNDVLLGGITNPSMIALWLDIIDVCEVPLMGIWSLPLLSKQLLPTIDAKTGPVLLVSQQVSSNLRQTFFRDGKMQASRQSVINQDENDISQIGTLAKPEVDRTIEYLRNQRLIASDEVMQIHVLGGDEQEESLYSAFESTALSKTTVHNLPVLHDKLSLKGLSGRFSDEMFASFCVNQIMPGCHYGKPSDYKQYYFGLGSIALYVLSLLVVLFAMLTAESNLSRALEHERSVELLNIQADEYRNVYKSKFEAFEPVFTHALSMNAAVDLAERIYTYGKVSPLDFMLEISTVLATQGLGKVYIDDIRWEYEQFKSVKGKEVIVAKQDLTKEDPVRHLGVLKGRIDVSDSNYRGSIAKVNKIIDALLKHERIVSVELVEMPVDVRSEKSFTDQSGVDANIGSNADKGKFTLKIRMEAASNA